MNRLKRYIPIVPYYVRTKLEGNINIVIDIACKREDGVSVPLPQFITLKVEVTDTLFNRIEHIDNHQTVIPWNQKEKFVNLLRLMVVDNPDFNINIVCTELDILLYGDSGDGQQLYKMLDYEGFKTKSFSKNKVKFYAMEFTGSPDDLSEGPVKYTPRITFSDVENYFDLHRICPDLLDYEKDSIPLNCITKYPFVPSLHFFEKEKIIIEYLLELLSLTSQQMLFPTTISSCAYNLFKSKYVMPEKVRDKFPDKKTLIYTHNSLPVQKMERLASHGARTEVYYHGKYPDKVYQIDINNLYGYIMKNLDIPISLLANRPVVIAPKETLTVKKQMLLTSLNYDINTSLTELPNLPSNGVGVIAEVVVYIDKNQKIAPVAIDPDLFNIKALDDEESKPNIIFPTGVFTAYVTTEMLKYLLSIDAIMDVKRFTIYETANLLRFFVDDMNALRETKMEDGTIDPIKRHLAKHLTNLLSGKFGQRRRTNSFVRKVTSPETAEEKSNEYNKHYIEHNDNIYEVTDGEEYSKHSFPAVYAHITDTARLYMYREMEKIGFDNILYIDNDGLIINQAGFDKIKNELHPSELGKFKLEHEGYVDIKGNKTYTIYSDENHTGTILKDVKVSVPKGREVSGEGRLTYSLYQLNSTDKLVVDEISLKMDYTKLKNRIKKNSLTEPYFLYQAEKGRFE